MAKKITIVAIALVVVIAVLCTAVALQPDRYSIQRSILIEAPPGKVFQQVNDLAAWDAWSPWKELDPNPKTTLSNPSFGKGAQFSWSGNAEIGRGTLTILESKPDELVELEQAFVKPMEGKCRLEFALSPEGSGAKLTWTMDGENDFLGKAMCLFMDMDGMVGPKFEQGLANIKTLAEKSDAQPVEPPSASDIPATTSEGNSSK